MINSEGVPQDCGFTSYREEENRPVGHVELRGPDLIHWQDDLVVSVLGRVPGQIGIFPDLVLDIM